MSSTYVVIAVRNRAALTRACLTSLAAQTLPHTTVVVDDGSTDGTSEMIRSEFPEVLLMHGDGNLWWTGATNAGVAAVLSRCRADDLVVTLNDDTTCDCDYLERLTAPAVEDLRLLVGSVAVTHDDPDVVFDGGVRVDWWRAKYTWLHRGERFRDAFADGSLQAVDVLPGRGTLIPARAFRELGPYDGRRLPHYGADYEFSRRAARAGYRLVVNPSAVLAVHESRTGIHAAVAQGGTRTLLRSFASRRSANDLRTRVNFALLAAPREAVVPFLAFDVGRVVLGSLRRSLRRDAAS